MWYSKKVEECLLTGLILSCAFEMQLPCEVTQGNHDTWMKSSRINKLLADLADKYSYMNELGKSGRGMPS